MFDDDDDDDDGFELTGFLNPREIGNPKNNPAHCLHLVGPA